MLFDLIVYSLVISVILSDTSHFIHWVVLISAADLLYVCHIAFVLSYTS